VPLFTVVEPPTVFPVGKKICAIQEPLHAEGVAGEVLATKEQSLFEQQHRVAGGGKLIGRDRSTGARADDDDVGFQRLAIGQVAGTTGALADIAWLIVGRSARKDSFCGRVAIAIALPEQRIDRGIVEVHRLDQRGQPAQKRALRKAPLLQARQQSRHLLGL
jgi:hypothetical protein